jgi:ABC-type ATPase with predicted acetyltransferase domain
MPKFKFTRQTKVDPSFRNESVKGQFDLNISDVVETFQGNIDIEDKAWSIGLIVGSSGSGKSSIAKEIFKDGYVESFKYNNKSVLDNMPKNKSTEEITKIFNSVGFATVWSWLKPYHVLSNGEKMRVDLAQAILSDKKEIVFDEFTSVVDRTVAKTASFAISKAVRKLGKKFVAVACHYDIIEWLEPDWIYDTDKKEFFFAQKNTKDPKSKLKLENAKQPSGDFLKSITI